MKKYLDMENATLELDLRTKKKYKLFLENNTDYIYSLNFKRIIFHIKESKLITLYELLKKRFKESSILIMIYSSLNNNISLDFVDNIIIINTNEKSIINNDHIFNLISLSEKNIDHLAKIINDEINVIVKPVINTNNIALFNKSFTELTKRVEGKRINLDGYLVPSFLMREHPCNAYLCDGCHCKKNISTLPKYITINKNFDVYPHDLYYEKLKIGNVTNKNISNILDNYHNTEPYIEFINYCKRVFIKYLSHYPYQYMPIIEFVRMEIEHDK